MVRMASPARSAFVLLLAIGAAAAEPAASKGKMDIKSAAFEANGDIPKKYTCKGADVSPPLVWEGVPAGAKSLALICDDPDAPVGVWVHWVLYGLSPQLKGLPEGVAKTESVVVEKSSAMQGLNDFGRAGYGGPCPPPGAPHRYFFKLYALDAAPRLHPKASKAQLLKAMEGHILGQAELVGRFAR